MMASSDGSTVVVWPGMKYDAVKQNYVANDMLYNSSLILFEWFTQYHFNK